MSNPLETFQQLLRELFQFDCADLDFGIYQIMNFKRDAVERFITQDLPQAVTAELEQGALAEKLQAAQELQGLTAQVKETLGADALDADGELAAVYHDIPLGKRYLELKAKAAGARSRDALESTIYNHLLAFFSHYYQDGDFISKRRYSTRREVYAIPYNGEEVTLYWANRDQYYVKTAEHFTDYTWAAPNGVTVHFKLQAADVEQNNVKGEKRFVLPRPAEIAWDAAAARLVIPFEYRPLTEQESIAYGGKNQQEMIIAKTLEDLTQRHKGTKQEKDVLVASCLGVRTTTADGRPVTYLEHHLRQYTRRNTSDFFIHKDLKGFLTRELDFYLKNEVLSLDEMDAAGEARAAGWFQMLHVIRAVGGRIIEFLAQVEEFQKMLWEKRKLITETFYCITVRVLPEALHPEIAACDAQWEEWRALFHIDELPDYPSPLRGEGQGEGPGEGQGEGQIKSRRKEQRSALLTSFAREMRQAPTDAEGRLWYFLRDRRLGGYKFRRQHPMGPYIVDFICIEARLILELDGGQHNTLFGRESDQERTQWLEGQGFKVVRFWNDEVLKNTRGVLETIFDELEMAPHPDPLPNGEREVEFLTTHPTLVLDTRHFDRGFVDRLLGSFDDLDEMTDSLLVHSENWQALNLMAERYRGKVKCAYIDPPYNTGGDGFLYKDMFQHSSWISMMDSRLELARTYLRPNGSIFVNIDDHETSNLGLLLGRVFSAENYVGTAVWKRTVSRPLSGGKILTAHDYVMAYQRTQAFEVNRLDVEDKDQYKNPDHDPRGPYKLQKFERTMAGARPTMTYTIETPTGPVTRTWSGPRETYDKLLAENRIVFSRSGFRSTNSS